MAFENISKYLDRFIYKKDFRKEEWIKILRTSYKTCKIFTIIDNEKYTILDYTEKGRGENKTILNIEVLSINTGQRDIDFSELNNMYLIYEENEKE